MQDVLVAAVLLGVVTYRVWRVFALDQITEPGRAWLLARDGRVWVFLGDMVLCAWCLGWWIAGLAAAAVGLARGWDLLTIALVWVASSGVAGLISTWTERDHG